MFIDLYSGNAAQVFVSKSQSGSKVASIAVSKIANPHASDDELPNATVPLPPSSPTASLRGAGLFPRILSRHNQILGFANWDIMYSSQTSPGMSGSPVLLGDGRLLAVHRRGGPLINDPGVKAEVSAKHLFPGFKTTTAFSVGVRVDLWLLDEFGIGGAPSSVPRSSVAEKYCDVALQEIHDIYATPEWTYPLAENEVPPGAEALSVAESALRAVPEVDAEAVLMRDIMHVLLRGDRKDVIDDFLLQQK